MVTKYNQTVVDTICGRLVWSVKAHELQLCNCHAPGTKRYYHAVIAAGEIAQDRNGASTRTHQYRQTAFRNDASG